MPAGRGLSYLVMSLLRVITKPFRTLLFQLKWRSKNPHNRTKAINVFHIENVKVGNSTYGPIEVLYDNGSGRLTIGNYCSIAKDVKFLLGGGHDYRRISTFPFQSMVYKGFRSPSRDERIDIVVEDDVWIGFDSIILAGARIGKGSVIGARSVVTGTVPPYSVYVANKVIKKRFADDIINKINFIDYGRINHFIGDSYQSYCDKEITEANIEETLEAFTK